MPAQVNVSGIFKLFINRNGKNIDAVAIATKHGLMFVFDRVTGKPIFPIEEKPFTASKMPGEKSWPTQPIPTVVPHFTRHEVTKEMLNPYLPEEEKQKWYKRIAAAKSGLYVARRFRWSKFWQYCLGSR